MVRKIKGFSLIEALIVVAIIAVLLAIAVPPLTKWRMAYNIESDMKKIQSTLQEARSKAFTEKIELSVDVSSNTICYRCQSTDSICVSKYGTGCIKTENLAYTYDSKTVNISKRGTFSNNTTIKYPTENPASFDCVVISNLRAKLEKCNGH
ncbi:pilus assembly FimT family protein [Persephonella sp.]